MIKKQLEQYKAYCLKNGLKPQEYKNLKAYTRGEGLTVHLTTGYYWLLSIKTNSNDPDEALQQAAAYAINANMRFMYIVDGSHEMYELVNYEICDNPNIEEMDTYDVMVMLDYYYMDMSAYNLPNIWISMRDTKIDRNTYDNTIIL